MNPIVLIGLALVGYFVYENYFATTTTTAPPAGTGTGTPPPAVTPPSQLTAIGTNLLNAAVLAGGPNPQLSADQWGYYYALPNVAGTPAPAPNLLFGTAWNDSDRSVNGVVNMPYSTYWTALSAYLQAQGMSGLSGVGYMGWA